MSLLSRQNIPLIVVSVGSLLVFVNILFLLVNYNTHLAIIEYLDPNVRNQTSVRTNWRECCEKGQEMINQVENAENTVDLISSYWINGSSTESANCSVDLVTDYRRHGFSMKNADTFSGKMKNADNSVRRVTDHRRNGSSKLKLESCDFSHGKWIYDTTRPLYRNSTCPIITPSQNCQRNGKPEKAYENWRWKPNECELPQLDGRKFLELVRGKTLAFVGDSLSRNQMVSLVCILWQTEVPVRTKDPRIHKWYFKSSSTTIALIWSAWLVDSTPPPDRARARAGVKIYLDSPHKSYMDFLPNFDVLILSSGHWFTSEPTYVLNGTVIIRRQLRRTKRSQKKQQGSDKSYDIARATQKKTEMIKSDVTTANKRTGVIKSSGVAADKKPDILRSKKKSDMIKKSSIAHELEIDIPFKSFGIALQTALNAIVNHPNYTGLTIFRSYSPNHYVRGAWNTGGTCVSFNRPSSKLQISEHETAMLKKQVEEVEGAAKRVRNGSKLRFMDISKLSAYRHDGHPGPYTAHTHQGREDCVHWCMPGPVDAWNEILFEILRREI